MAAALLPDALWDLVEPLLPSSPARPKGGRPRLPDRACLTGIVFVLRSAIPWQMLPQELGGGSGMTCWRRLRDWQAAGRGVPPGTGYPPQWVVRVWRRGEGRPQPHTYL